MLNLQKEVQKYTQRLQSHLSRSKHHAERRTTIEAKEERQKAINKFSNFFKEVSKNRMIHPHNVYQGKEAKYYNFHSS